MKRFLSLLAVGAVSVALANDATAQNRNFGAERFIMDDGDGQRMTLQTPALMDGNPTYTFPQFTGISTANVVLDEGVYTLNGVYTFTQEIIVNTGLNPDLRINENAIHRGITPGNIGVNPGPANFLTTDGSITQSGAGQNTFTGNVDALNGLDVTGAPLTANANATLTGAVDINFTGAGVTRIGNSAGGNVTIGVDDNTTNLSLTGIINDGAPTRILTLNVGDNVRTSNFSDLADEGVSWDPVQFQFELGGESNVAVPFTANPRWVNINASTLNFSSNGGALIPFQITGGAAPTINSVGVTNINTGTSNAATNINSGTGTGAVAIGNTATSGVTVLGPTSINANNATGDAVNINTGTSTGATTIGNAATGGAVAIATPGNFTVVSDDFLVDAAGNTTIDGTTTHNNSVYIQTAATTYPGDGQSVALRASAPGSAWTGAGAFGGTGLAGRTVILGQVSGHAAIGGHNGVLSTWEDLYVNEGGGNVRIGSAVAPTSTLDITGSLANTGNVNLASAAASTAAVGNVAGFGNISLGNVGAGLGNITLNSSVTGNIVLNGVDADAVPTTMVTINGLNQVRATPLAGTAEQGVVFTAGQYKLGSAAADGVNFNDFDESRFVNIDAFNLNVTANAGALTPLQVIGGATPEVNITATGAGENDINGNTNITGPTLDVLVTTTNINAGVNANVTNINTGANTGTVNIGGAAVTNTVLGNTTVNTTGLGTTSVGNGNNALTLTGAVVVNGGASTGTTSINAGTNAANVVIGNPATAALDLTAVDIDLLGVTDITGATTINNVGTATTQIGNNIGGFGDVTIGNATGAAGNVTVGVATGGNLTLNGIDADAVPVTMLTINGTNQVRATPLAGTAEQGVVFSGGQYKLGSAVADGVNFNDFDESRFVNIDAFNLSITRNGGAENAIVFNGGAAGSVDVNTGSGNVNLGNAAGTNTVLGTTNIDGNTTINDGANAFTTNIATAGNSGAVNIGNIASGGAVLIASDNDITINADGGLNDVLVAGDILPTTDNVWNLGSPTNRYVGVYATPSSFHTYGTAAEVGGSIRDWAMGINGTGSYRIGEIATAGDAELFTISPAGNVSVDGSLVIGASAQPWTLSTSVSGLDVASMWDQVAFRINTDAVGAGLFNVFFDGSATPSFQITPAATNINNLANLNGAANIGNGDADAVAINTTGNFSIASSGLDVSTAGAISNATSIQGTGALTMTGAGSTIGSGANATQLTISGVADAGVTNELVVTGDAQVTGTATVGALSMLGNLDMNDNDIVELDDVTFTNSGVNPSTLTKLGGANLEINTTGGDLVVTGDGFSLATTTGLQVALTGEISHSGATVTVNDNLTVNGGSTLAGTVSQTGGGQVTLTGNLDANGGVDVGGNLTVSGTSVLTGNVDANAGLDVTGANLTVGGTNITATTAGVLTVRGAGSTFGPAVAADGTYINVNGVANTANYEVEVVGDIRATGNGNFGSLTINGDILPALDDTYDLGSPALRWQDLHLGPVSLHIHSNATDALPVRDWSTGINGAGDLQVGQTGVMRSILTDAGDYSVLGDVTSGDDLISTDDITAGDALTVAGITSLNGAVTLGNGADVITLNATPSADATLSEDGFNIAAGAGIETFAFANGAGDLNITTDGSIAAGFGGLNPVTLGSGVNEIVAGDGTINTTSAITTTLAVNAGNGVNVTTGGVNVTAGGVSITAGGLTVSAGGANISGGLTVNGNSIMNGNLDMTNDLIENIGAAGTDFTAGGGLTLAQALTVSAGGANITGGINNNNGGITNAGAIGATSVTATGAISGNTLSSTLGTTVGNTLTVSAGGANITGNSTINGDLNMSSKRIFNIGGANVNFDANGNLFMMNHRIENIGMLNTTFSNTGLNIAGTLGVTGTTTLTGALVANGASTLGNGDADAVAINTSGNFSIASSGLDVSTAGAISNATTIGATGAITTTGAGSAVGATSNATQLTINGQVGGVNNDLQVVGDANITGNVTAGGLILGGNLDMGNFLIENIGNAGTDFTAGGGLTLAGDLVVNGNTTLGNGADVVTLNSTGSADATISEDGFDIAAGAAVETFAFTNAGANVLNVTTDGSITAATGLTVSAGGASITGGINNNAGGVTSAGAVSGVTTLAGTFAQQYTILAAGTETIANASVTVNSIIVVTYFDANNNGVGSSVYVRNIVPGVSFQVVHAGEVGDRINYYIIN